jgi:hypothetical protein
MSRCFDGSGDKPIDVSGGQLRMALEQIGSMTSGRTDLLALGVSYHSRKRPRNSQRKVGRIRRFLSLSGSPRKLSGLADLMAAVKGIVNCTGVRIRI